MQTVANSMPIMPNTGVSCHNRPGVRGQVAPLCPAYFLALSPDLQAFENREDESGAAQDAGLDQEDQWSHPPVTARLSSRMHQKPPNFHRKREADPARSMPVAAVSCRAEGLMQRIGKK